MLTRDHGVFLVVTRPPGQPENRHMHKRLVDNPSHYPMTGAVAFTAGTWKN